MGKLKTNTSYIYERSEGVTYAREFGETNRIVVGYDFKAEEKKEDELWREIRKAARSNKSLQRALDRAKILYRLSKDDPL